MKLRTWADWPNTPEGGLGIGKGALVPIKNTDICGSTTLKIALPEHCDHSSAMELARRLGDKIWLCIPCGVFGQVGSQKCHKYSNIVTI